MKCYFCRHPETSVKDSRNTNENSVVRRRRSCPKCKSRFTTFERVQLREIFIIKRSGLKKPFDREKIIDSISTAVRKRNITHEQIQLIADQITAKLDASGAKEIPSKKIGDMILRALAKIDPVAYVRFASVYKDFSNIQDFGNFIKRIKD